MMIRSRLSALLLAVVASLSVIPAQADLVWERKLVDLKASPADQEVQAHYPFKNEGTEPVKFKTFKGGCDCVSITVSTMVVPPGGTGEVLIKFRPDYRIGEQKRPIAVQLDDAKQTRFALYLRVEIPEVIRPQPILMKWTAEDKLEPKTVTIVTDEKYPVESMKVLPVSPPVQATITQVENSPNYLVSLLPKRTGEPQAYTLEVEATLADGLVKRTSVYVFVR